MKKIILSALFLAISSPLVTMEQKPGSPAQPREENSIYAKKQVTVAKPAAKPEEKKEDEVSKKHSFLACLACEKNKTDKK